jgi:hypothetical protein
VVASNVPGIVLFLLNSKQYNHLSYIAFIIIHLCNYTFLLMTGEVLKTFLEAILWKPFQLLSRILNYVSSIKKRRPFNANFSRGTAKDQLEPGYMDVSVLLQCSLLRNPWPKQTSVLKHCREG